MLFFGQVLFNDNTIKSIRRVLQWNNKLLFSDIGLQEKKGTYGKLMMCGKPKNL